MPGYTASRPGIQVGTKLAWDASDDDIRFVQQLGVEWVMTEIPHDEHGRPAVGYRAFRERVERHGLKVYRLGNRRCHNMSEVTLNLPGRDAKIEEYLAYIRALGEAGIRYSTYAHMGNGIWSGEPRADPRRRRGAGLSRRRPGDGWWGGKRWRGPLTHGRRYSEDELWANFEHFIRKVVPVAEEAGVYIGIHPDDPPVYPLGGVPRCIFGSFDGYRRAIEIAASPNIGVCLCTGCWLEGGPAMGRDVLETVALLCGQKKLFKVHLRNVTAPMPEGFAETFLDAGYMDMHRVIEALHEVGLRRRGDVGPPAAHGRRRLGGRGLCHRPDQGDDPRGAGPRVACGDPGGGLVFTVLAASGYDRVLLMSTDAESARGWVLDIDRFASHDGPGDPHGGLSQGLPALLPVVPQPRVAGPEAPAPLPVRALHGLRPLLRRVPRGGAHGRRR